ncbi:spore germination protein [Cohnella sp. CFH 77786]|uniref:spore germination protein n=1 Tax=Cohnella sp. CFH 77786 TaxID=2662265 RepID=UPI001C6083B7|nr:spore germination protein [Cohnella sp. CFH 77786]MBW5449123.1 spore germination protein [Cohnella sp. CFH 77786]
MKIQFRKQLSRNSPVKVDDADIRGEGVIAANLEQNEHFVRQEFRNCSDMVYSEISTDGGQPKRLLVYLGTLVNEEKVNGMFKTIAAFPDTRLPEGTESENGKPIPVGKVFTSSKWSEIIRRILRGNAVLFTDGSDKADCFAAENMPQRSIEEPSSEPSIRGSKEGFVERQSVNVGLLRHYIRTPRLKMEAFTVGEMTETKVLVAYIEGLADESVVERLRNKIAAIRADGILESGYIEEIIRDDPFPIFPIFQNTERPDVVAGGLLEGRVAILVDNTPFVILAPVTFWSGLQASEDYYVRYPVASFVRGIRLLFLFIAVFVPSFYVAVTTFHQEMIPTSLLLSVASAREPVPFPIVLEALLMELMFEALREAGVRLPRPIGQTVSIVGALVIGQSAVQAGIISAPSVIIVSMTGIAAFLIPRFSFANGVRLLRFPMIVLAGTLGLYGIALGFLGILLRVVHLKSFGVPYFTPVSPFSKRALKDVFFRAPIDGRVFAPQYEKDGTK